jgi:hypothetical protein
VLPPTSRSQQRQAVVDIIREAARARGLRFAPAASKRLLGYDRDPEAVSVLLEGLRVSDIRNGPNEGVNYPDCDVYAVVVEDDEEDAWGRPLWYLHLGITRSEPIEVRVLSFKLNGSAA